MRIQHLGTADAALVVSAGELFDSPPDQETSARFLAAPGHHLFIAYEGDRPVGFVSGVEMTHPDKGTEMFLYELAVHEDFRRRGIGRALVETLFRLGRDLGCYGMWVLTDADNEAARATYGRAGGREDGEHLMFSWGDPGQGVQRK